MYIGGNNKGGITKDPNIRINDGNIKDIYRWR